MKFLCDRQQLHDAFSVVASIAPSKTTRPILQQVLATADGDTLTLFATDLEMSAKVVLDQVKVDRPGTILLPARETSALLKELTDPTISLSSSEQRSTLESGAGSFVLLGGRPEEYPEPTKLEGASTVELSAGRFVEMVRKTSFAAAREETRYAINGVLVELVGGSLRLVATDGRRLALVHDTPDDAPGESEDLRAVVPLQVLQTLVRALSEAEDDERLRLHVSERQIGFEAGNTTLVSQLLDNRFPDYEGVIPKACETTVDIDKAMLDRNLRKVAILSRGDVRMVQFKFEGSSLQLSAESSGVGRGEVTMEVDVRGPGGSISFNPDYVLDALKTGNREVVQLDMTDEQTPARFTLGESYTYVLMPISGS
jgi:DNA polymerase-3 subunit beta